jgi:HD-GYP domain-containing protein (c-di-GMP phosphodiesterase class II)
LHDVGHVLLPRAIQGVPEPLLDAKSRAVYRTHTTEGALALMSAGCPDLWIAAALEHHRGVDGLGYPTLSTKEPPHELVRMIALASFLDSKRTRIDGAAVDPDEALRLALALEDRYFGRPLVSRCVRAIGAYPPGTTVELSNRAPALVTQVNLGDPWRPQVQLLRGADAGTRVELRELNSVEVRYELSITDLVRARGRTRRARPPRRASPGARASHPPRSCRSSSSRRR